MTVRWLSLGLNSLIPDTFSHLKTFPALSGRTTGSALDTPHSHMQSCLPNTPPRKGIPDINSTSGLSPLDHECQMPHPQCCSVGSKVERGPEHHQSFFIGQDSINPRDLSGSLDWLPFLVSEGEQCLRTNSLQTFHLPCIPCLPIQAALSMIGSETGQGAGLAAGDPTAPTQRQPDRGMWTKTTGMKQGLLPSPRSKTGRLSDSP